MQLKLAELESRLNYAGGSDVSTQHLSTPSAPASLSGQTPQVLPPEPLWQSGASRFPAAVFLDSRMFHWNGLRIPEPTAEIPNVSLIPASPRHCGDVNPIPLRRRPVTYPRYLLLSSPPYFAINKPSYITKSMQMMLDHHGEWTRECVAGMLQTNADLNSRMCFNA